MPGMALNMQALKAINLSSYSGYSYFAFASRTGSSSCYASKIRYCHADAYSVKELFEMLEKERDMNRMLQRQITILDDMIVDLQLEKLSLQKVRSSFPTKEGKDCQE